MAASCYSYSHPCRIVGDVVAVVKIASSSAAPVTDVVVAFEDSSHYYQVHLPLPSASLLLNHASSHPYEVLPSQEAASCVIVCLLSFADHYAAAGGNADETVWDGSFHHHQTLDGLEEVSLS